jgi:L-alanine-DL-glutamate epimerase-like enolase superfamily enzyme
MAVVIRVERQEAIPLRIPMPGGSHEAVILVLHADGLIGLGEAPALAQRGPGLEDLVAELAAGGQIRSASARSAWETAMLDLEGRTRGVRGADLLGGVRRERVTCNAMVGPMPAAAVADEIAAWLARGFNTFKLKSANLGGPLDLERLGAARWAAGPAGRLRLDFNGGLSATLAGAALPSLASFGLELVEQPLSVSAPTGEWIDLASRGGVSLAADESLADPAQALELAAAGIGQAIKLATVGGPRAALELAGAGSGALVFSSSFETSIGLAAALHTACASARPPEACGLATAHLLEADPVHGLDWSGPELLLPSGPGLGVELDIKALRRYRLDR